MTSTSFNVGLNGENKSSSRVLRPPGGGHTDIFGGEPEPPRGRRLLHGAPDQMCEPRKPANGTEAPQNGAQTPDEPAPAPAPAVVKPDSPAKAEPAKEPATIPEAAKAEAPKRVRVPPGGFSSGLW